MEDLVDLELGRVTVLFGEKQGKYPQGNTLVVRGDEESLVIDPCLGLIPRRDRLPVRHLGERTRIDRAARTQRRGRRGVQQVHVAGLPPTVTLQLDLVAIGQPPPTLAILGDHELQHLARVRQDPRGAAPIAGLAVGFERSFE